MSQVTNAFKKKYPKETENVEETRKVKLSEARRNLICVD